MQSFSSIADKHYNKWKSLSPPSSHFWLAVPLPQRMFWPFESLRARPLIWINNSRQHFLKIHFKIHFPSLFQVQSFFRGWLCRRRWKQIVELYIRSPHAESMRKRNSIVFNMVECEEEYNRQLSTLVTCFLRPFRMAASSKKPPITHEDVNSIFLNRWANQISCEIAFLRHYLSIYLSIYLS